MKERRKKTERRGSGHRAALLLDLFYPPRCPLCGGALPVGERVHPSCLGDLIRIRGCRCGKCGKPVAEGERLCSDCRSVPHRFDRGWAAFVYEGALRDAVWEMKFKGKKEYAVTLGMLAAEEAAPFLRDEKPDLLVPVPMHRSKRRVRGFNQALVIAKAVSERYGIPCAARALERRRETKAMKALTEEERRANLASAFRAADSLSLSGKKVCLIDDLYTTGATADACAEVCFSAGASRVTVLCVGTGDDR